MRAHKRIHLVFLPVQSHLSVELISSTYILNQLNCALCKSKVELYIICFASEYRGSSHPAEYFVFRGILSGNFEFQGLAMTFPGIAGIAGAGGTGFIPPCKMDR